MKPYYQRDGITLYHGSAEEVLPTLPHSKADLCVTSPPYNKAGFEGTIRTVSSNEVWASHRNIAYDNYNDFMPEPQYQLWQIQVVNMVSDALCEGGSLFYNHKIRVKDYTCSFPTEWLQKTNLKIRQEITWNRSSTPNLAPIRFKATTEKIYWMFKGRAPKQFNKRAVEYGEVWNILPERNNPHPAPYPAQVPQRCIEATTSQWDLVLDPFSGSGTTALACIATNRRFWGIEKSEAYCEMSVKRIDFALSQPSMFDDTENTQGELQQINMFA